LVLTDKTENFIEKYDNSNRVSIRGFLIRTRETASEDLNLARLIKEGSYDEILEFYTSLYEPETKEDFLSSLKTLNSEFNKFKGPVFVDNDTGIGLFEITKEHLFQPSKYIDHNGNQVTPKPIIHPSISSFLALAKQNVYNMKKFRGENNENVHLYISNTDVIIDKLKESGELKFSEEKLPNEYTISFGHENIDMINEKLNQSFHRHEVLIKILVSKLKNAGYVNIEKIEMRTNKSKRWFDVTLTSENVLSFHDENSQPQLV